MRLIGLAVVLALGVALAPLSVGAQPAAMPMIGYLGSASPDVFASRLRAFRQGLSEAGYVEGRNVVIEYRWAEGQYDRFPALAADLVRHKVAVIAAPGSTPAAVAAKAATTTIPIVFVTATDPVETGLVASLNRPGGNATGVAVLSVETGPKQLEVLHEMIPKASAIALLVNPTSPTVSETQSRALQAAARTLGLKIHVLHASTERDFDTVFATLIQQRANGLVISSEALFTNRSTLLAALSLRHGVPAIYQFREFAAAGGLMSYGPSLTDGHRLAGVYVGRILKGAKPADLPVEQPTKFELVVNLKTAKALGLTIPQSLLVRADQVID
jgi:putative ABC transport system substrate-binding protein